MSKGKIVKDREISRFGMPSFDSSNNHKVEDEIPVDYEGLGKKAYEEGFRSGEKAGYDMGMKKAEVILNSLENLIKDFSQKIEETIKAMEPQAVALSFAITKRILKDELSTNPERIVNLIKIAMRRLAQSGQIIIRINPALSEIINNHKPQLLQINSNVRIEEDPQVALSAPVVYSSEQEIPIDIEEQLTNLIDELGERIGSHNS